MAQKEVRNNVTINTANKEDKKMKKDYTLNGKLTATTWQEFRVAMKEVGINTGTKTYEQLVEEYNALPKGEVVPAGDMSSDKYYPELHVEQENKSTINKRQGNYIMTNVVKKSFIATKGNNIGDRLVTLRKLYGIIASAYLTEEDKKQKKQLPVEFIESVIEELVRLKYLICIQHDTGARIYGLTVKCKKFLAA